MTVAPVALFDVEALRSIDVPTLGAPGRASPTIVLGSTQRVGDLDERSILRDGVSLARRRGGGGAVLLRPDDCWLELWLPAAHARNEDVRAVACEVGEWWRAALGGLGVEAAVHRDGMVAREQGAVACFAGIGPGELTVEGRKLVGLSQWRPRQGSLVSSVVAARPPLELAAYLASSALPVPSLERATCLADVDAALDAFALADAFEAAVRAAHPDLVRSPFPFS